MYIKERQLQHGKNNKKTEINKLEEQNQFKKKNSLQNKGC